MVANPFGPVHAYVNGPCGPHSSTLAPAQAESGPLIAHGGGWAASTALEHGPNVAPDMSLSVSV
ncbi:MAG: hypothetical protein E6K72_08855 [Candidatus Eisenbacteria bacterium]|uniref:Uncharacterized protein n=1 Tax=Eiseniibacteriota bacterium TaxID=2212470 RepID=A0A538SNG3_UNCEI|nr:MAG: hypothetical protein E6K72_08855 [Candidatus Eisenbacteria bacterium]